ncbi:MAG TPA: hypothetical protein VFL91_26300 [Thermomicrobiales bacterium]|nr:hypothetical protein [Thermomicrobiales bacterium]
MRSAIVPNGRAHRAGPEREVPALRAGRLALALVQGALVGGFVHLWVLQAALANNLAGHESEAAALQGAVDDLLPLLLGYLGALFLLLVARVGAHAFTLDADPEARMRAAFAESRVPLGRRVATGLRRLWAPGRRWALAGALLGAGLAAWLNLWWFTGVERRAWPRALDYAPGKYDWILAGTAPATAEFCAALALVFLAGLLAWRVAPAAGRAPRR